MKATRIALSLVLATALAGHSFASASTAERDLAPRATTAGLSSGSILVGLGMGPIRLGQSPSTVRRKIGAPEQIQPYGGGPYSYRYGATEIGPHSYWSDVAFTGKRGTLQSGGVVYMINSTYPGLRTASGIGVGSTLQAVRIAYPHASCYQHKGYSPACELKTAYHGHQISTIFETAGKRPKVRFIGIEDETAMLRLR